MTYCEQTLSVYLPCPASHGNQIIHSLNPGTNLKMQEKNSGILQASCEVAGSFMANSNHAMILLKGDFWDFLMQKANCLYQDIGEQGLLNWSSVSGGVSSYCFLERRHSFLQSAWIITGNPAAKPASPSVTPANKGIIMFTLTKELMIHWDCLFGKHLQKYIRCTYIYMCGCGSYL